MDEHTKAEILALERGLLDPTTRHLLEWLERTLAEDMTEFGKSGRAYSRGEIIQSLVGEARSPVALFAIAGPRLTELASDVVLLTYRLEPLVLGGSKPTAASLRSSIWRKRDGRWQLVFHQGTATG